jgi:hypothetical protein
MTLIRFSVCDYQFQALKKQKHGRKTVGRQSNSGR